MKKRAFSHLWEMPFLYGHMFWFTDVCRNESQAICAEPLHHVPEYF